MAYQDWAVERGIYDAPQPYLFNLYLEPIQQFRLAGQGKGEHQPPDHLREQIVQSMDPLPTWWEPFEQTTVDTDEYPLHALTQRPAAMYHSWGSQNAWLRQIHGHNPMYVPTNVWEENGFEEGDWAYVTSPHGKIKVPVARMDALNPNTIWTWNAIGKRKGAWALDKDAPETKKGFLLNHLIRELLPDRNGGMRWSNSDPITGQAAWYDLRVRIEKAPAGEQSEPLIEPQQNVGMNAPKDIKYGEEF
jgi:anaerobic selenocysteine-containing dehydrogenase